MTQALAEERLVPNLAEVPAVMTALLPVAIVCPVPDVSVAFAEPVLM